MADPKAGPVEQVTLREVTEDDLPVFFANQLDPEAGRMAAFTARDPSDRDAFMAHWAKIMASDDKINRTILVDGRVAGYIVCFEWHGRREVGYWLGREFWGRGIATRALAQLLDIVKERPLYASAARDNAGSIRVLEKCGFVLTGYARGFANARGEEIEEAVMELR
jgi:RimJ/RimL family protein N-acetyltransferase